MSRSYSTVIDCAHYHFQESKDMIGQVGNGDNGDHKDYTVSNEDAEQVHGGRSAQKKKAMASQNQKEKLAAAAQFSINKINLFNPPKPLVLGKLNPRELNKEQVKKLKQAFAEEGIKPFTMENMMPLMINRHYVDPGCIWMGMNGYDAPELKLSMEGIRDLEGLDVVGGRHRLEAITKVNDEINLQLDGVKKRVKVLREKSTKNMNDEERKMRKEELTKLLKQTKELKNKKDENSQWGIILYDAGK
jgi:hypothetical protein